MQFFNQVSSKLISKLFGYYDGQLHQITIEQEGVTFEQTVQSFPFIILARHLYSETSKFYPVSNRRELEKILAFELGTNDFFQLKVHEKDDGFTVITWQTLENNLNYQWLIPESALLDNILEKEQLYTVNYARPFYFIKHQNSLYSLPKSPLVANAELFSSAVGANVRSENSNSINAEQFKLMLVASIRKFNPIWLKIFRKKSGDKPLDIKKPVLLTLITSFAYLALSSGYLFYQQYQADNQLASLQGDLKGVLALEQRHEQLSNRLFQLSGILSKRQLSTWVWKVLQPVYQSEARIIQVQFYNNRYVIRGQAASATTILTLINKQPGVSDAKFDTNISKQQKREKFVISFLLDSKQVINSLHIDAQEPESLASRSLSNRG